MLNAFTVDVEDYFQVSAFERQIGRDRWGEYESRVVGSTRRLLELLKRHEVKATFFVLGWVAERYPDLVREIDAAGHELASHGYWHRLIYDQTPDEFREDLCRARDLLADLIGRPVVAYRAPSFSIIERSRWALDILAEEGFTIDSSIYPIHHDRYGLPGAPPHLHRLETGAGPLWEFPPSSIRVAGKNIPVGGGGYFRLYPIWLTSRWLAQINRRQQQPFLVYVHPWELDPDQPRLPAGTSLSRWRHRVNLGTTERKLDRLLAQFRFGPVSEVVRDQTDRAAEVRATERQRSAVSTAEAQSGRAAQQTEG
jgi:polysaccharide deacetylase family protein (PEP-CTERM system associated)